MLRFAVFEQKQPAASWALDGAHLLGPEDLAVSGSIRFAGGHIEVTRPGMAAVGLCLLHDAGRMGRLMLQTCLLPDRERPYLLSVELARHRIKMFIAKSEEWQLFDLAADHPAMRLWEQARESFTKALTATIPAEADQFARAALATAVEATERLALAHAEILLHRRFAQRPASSTTLGVRVWPGRHGSALQDLLAKQFDVVWVPIRWRQVEAEEGRYRWDDVDRWIEWARSTGKPVVAGPLLDFSERAVPPWLSVWRHDYDTCRDLAYDHVERVVQRYRGAVGMWSVAAGLNDNDNFHFTPQQMNDLVRMASLVVRQGPRGGRAMVEVVQPFGETVPEHRDAVPPLTFIERLLQEGIRIDAVGVQVLMGRPQPGRYARDLMHVSSVLDRFYYLELPVFLSAAGVPAVPVEGGGSWREPWSPQIQARWATQLFAIAMSKPYVESIFWSDLYDHAQAELPGAGLIGERGRARPALQKLVGLRKRLRKPLGVMKQPIQSQPSGAP